MQFSWLKQDFSFRDSNRTSNFDSTRTLDLTHPKTVKSKENTQNQLGFCTPKKKKKHIKLEPHVVPMVLAIGHPYNNKQGPLASSNPFKSTSLS